MKNVHVLGIRSKMQLKAGALQHANKLLAVGCFCIGTNQVDLEVRTGYALPGQYQASLMCPPWGRDLNVSTGADPTPGACVKLPTCDTMLCRRQTQ